MGVGDVGGEERRTGVGCGVGWRGGEGRMKGSGREGRKGKM